MSLFSTFKSLGNSVVGNIEVSESNKYITIHGFNGHRLIDAINKAWGTSKISNNIFHSATYIAVKFHKFFLMDIIYTLEKLIDEPKVPVSRRSLRIAVSKLKELTELRAVFQPGVDNSLIDRNAVNLFSVSPLPWQSEYLDIYSDRLLKYRLKGHLLDAKPGTGKTIASLILMESLKSDTIIVVSPKNAVIDVWKETLDNKYKSIPKYFHSLSGLPPTIGQHVYVIHYEYIPKFLEYLSKVNVGDLGKVGLVLDECLDPNTEVLTPTGFKKITDVTTDDLVLQYHPDGSNNWVNPSRVVKKHTLEVHHYQHDEWEQVVTPNHRMIFFDDTTKKIKESLSRNCDLSIANYKTIVRKDEVDVLVDNTTTTKTIEHLDKPVDFYCVTVPTGMFYIRYNGKVSVTGNCHNFNEINSQRTQSLIELTKKYVHYSLWMSGTPIKALGKEVIPFLHCIDPLFDEQCEKSFAAVFGKNSERALDILANRIGILSHTVKKEDVVSDVKLYRYQANVTLKNGDDYTLPVIRLKMKAFIEERSKFYKENMKSFEEDYKYGIELYRNSIKNKTQEIKLLDDYLSKVHEIKKGWDPYTMKDISRYCNTFERTKIIPMLPSDIKKAFRKAKSVYKYVNLTIMGECLGSILGKARTQCNVDIASNLGEMKLIPLNYGPDLGLMTLDEILTNAKKKTIMFTSFVEVVTTLRSKLMAEQYRPAVVFGETNKDLPKIVESFDKEDAVNPLVATFQSLSTAVPLIMANTIIMLNIPFRDKDYVQAVARAHRKGQTEDVYVIDVLLDTGDVPNISTRSKDIATEAAQMVAKIMGVDIDEETLMSLTGEEYSEEGCVACGTQGTMFKDSNVQVSQHPSNEDPRLPYYRTDIGPKVNEMLEMIEDDPDLDQVRADLFSSDVTKKDTIGVEISNTDAKNPKFYQWM
nr:MAG TPA: Chromatin remodeling complex ATPase [Bacteriophage sp.]